MKALAIAAIAICMAAQPRPATYTIAGNVVDHLSGKPLGGILMRVVPVAQRDSAAPIAVLSAADGRF